MGALIIIFFLVASAFLAGSFRKLHQRYQDAFAREMWHVFLAETLSFLGILFLATKWPVLYISLGILNIIKGPFYWNTFRAIHGDPPVRGWALKLAIAYFVFSLGCIWLIPSDNNFLFYSTSAWFLVVHIPAVECFRRRPKIHAVSPMFMFGFMLFSKVAFLFTITFVIYNEEWGGVFFCLYCMANLSLGAVGFMVALGRAREEYESRLLQAKSDSDDLNLQLKSALDRAKIAGRAKDEFLGIMSHELRTPISGIIGMASVLKSSPLNDEQQEFAWAIEDSGKDLLLLVEQILDFSRYESGQIPVEENPFSVIRFMDHVLELLGGQSNRKGIELLVSMHSNVPNMVVGDEGKLRQVIINLLNNAIKFTDKGHVSVFLKVVSGPNVQTGKRLQCQVKDTGPGIAAEDMGRLFTPFFQADTSSTREFGGAGLGLAISKRLMLAMGGDVTCESKQGEGTTFTIHWPLKRPSEGERATHLDAFSRLKGIHIWVIHQHDAFGDWVEKSFKEAQMQSRSFPSAQDAIDAFTHLDDQDWPSMIILDEDSLAGCPMDRPLELLGKCIASAQKNCKLVVRSSHRFQSQARVDGILRRPTTPNRMIIKIDRILQKTASQSNVLSSKTSSDADLISTQVHQGACSVLVVEDHPINRKLAVILLEKLNCRVVTANHGEEALGCMEKQTFDIVLMDLHMPVMDGFETARTIRQRWGDADRPLLVALTAAASQQDRELAKASGLTEFLTKPIQFEQLEKLVERSRRPRPPSKIS